MADSATPSMFAPERRAPCRGRRVVGVIATCSTSRCATRITPNTGGGHFAGVRSFVSK